MYPVIEGFDHADKWMKNPGSYRHIILALIWVLSILCIGTIGYMFIERLSLIDALYTTINMMSTVGNLIHPLSEAGRLFAIFITALGVGSLLYAFGVGMEFMIEGHLSHVIKRRFMDRKIAALRNHYMVCGFGRVGSCIAEDLVAAHKQLVVIDENEQNLDQCIKRGYLAVLGDATQDSILCEAGIRHARCLLIATDNDAHNIYIALSARHLNNDVFIVARANHYESEAKLKLAGADHVISPYTIGGHQMANLAFQLNSGKMA